ncbi:hypothetical protein FQR65_LT13662 [Abscondita terminalis]|nr:hypothetical protein FQR65_LT13662 [Abscondita terminalis]
MPGTPLTIQEDRSSKKRRLETPPQRNISPLNTNELAQKTYDALCYIDEVRKISNSILKYCEDSQNTKKEIKQAVRTLQHKANKLLAAKTLIETLNTELHAHKTKLMTLDPEYRKQHEIQKHTLKLQQALDRGINDEEFVNLVKRKWPDCMFTKTSPVDKIDLCVLDQDFLVLHDVGKPDNVTCDKILDSISGMKEHLLKLEPCSSSPLMGTIQTTINLYEDNGEDPDDAGRNPRYILAAPIDPEKLNKYIPRLRKTINLWTRKSTKPLAVVTNTRDYNLIRAILEWLGPINHGRISVLCETEHKGSKNIDQLEIVIFAKAYLHFNVDYLVELFVR